jgi:hypothetical protein
MNIKGSFMVRENHTWKSNLQYKVLFLDDRLLFLRTSTQASWEYLVGAGGLVAFVISGQIFAQFPDFPVHGVVAGAIGLALVVSSYLLVKKKTKGVDKQIESSDKSPEELIDKIHGSFSIHYNEILTIEVQKATVGKYGLRKGTLLVRSMNYYLFDIVDPQPLEQIEKLALSIKR